MKFKFRLKNDNDKEYLFKGTVKNPVDGETYFLYQDILTTEMYISPVSQGIQPQQENNILLG